MVVAYRHEEERKKNKWLLMPGQAASAPPVDTQSRHTKAKEVCPVGGGVSYACAGWSRWSG